jgi:hypothetical protein
MRDAPSDAPSAAKRAQDPIVLDIRPPAEGGAPFVSIVVPLAPGEPAPEALIRLLPAGFETIFASGGSRASSMNRAAHAARGAHLWFVHADTIFSEAEASALLEAVQEGARALWWFDLRFDGGWPMRITERGVAFRSRVLGLPFGDQALCLPAAAFRSLGGYDEAAPYGEDHLLVWSAHHAGLPVRPIGMAVTTSARKYRDRGWARTTAAHLVMTLLQALPQMARSLTRRTKSVEAGPEERARPR